MKVIPNSPSRVGVSSEPKRTSMAETTFPSIIQASVRLSLLTQSTRPVRQRGSGSANGRVVGGYSSCRVGGLVRAVNASQVACVTRPSAGRPCRFWKADTDAVVTDP